MDVNILISACLLGIACRYDGQGKPLEGLLELMKRHTLIPVCPEVYGGLPTPRTPAERQGERVVTADGKDVTAQYKRGAEQALKLAKLYGCKCAVLKERSPSCGYGCIYDGTFTGALTGGNGVCAEMLSQNGVEVIGESRVGELLG